MVFMSTGRHFDQSQQIPLYRSALSTLNHELKVTANTVARMWHCIAGPPPYRPLVLASKVSQAIYLYRRITQATKATFGRFYSHNIYTETLLYTHSLWPRVHNKGEESVEHAICPVGYVFGK